MKNWEKPYLKELGVEHTQTRMDVVATPAPLPWDDSSSCEGTHSNNNDSCSSDGDSKTKDF